VRDDHFELFFSGHRLLDVQISLPESAQQFIRKYDRCKLASKLLAR